MKILNKKAKFNYKLLDRFEAGIVLTGAEVKAIKAGKADISQAYVKIKGNEAYLINANFAVNNDPETDARRTRKLLLHKDQILSILAEIQGKRLTIVPTKLYTKGHLIKVAIAIAKPKKKYQKKESLKRADLDREAQRALREDKLEHQKDSRR